MMHMLLVMSLLFLDLDVFGKVVDGNDEVVGSLVPDWNSENE
jgi:hypothetical protein